jgi:type II secretory pathway pseudopilin PulG
MSETDRLGMKKKMALTLREILIVAGIIAIAAAIAVPWFLRAQVRGKLSQERGTLRSINQALLAYAVEINADPPDLSYLTRRTVYSPPVRSLDGTLVSEVGPWIKEIPKSAFGRRDTPQYYNLGNDWLYVLWTPGPDGVYDILGSDKLKDAVSYHYRLALIESGHPAPSKESDWFCNLTYDATNGLSSRGDMVQWRE